MPRSLQSPMRRSRVRISGRLGICLTLALGFTVVMVVPEPDLPKLKQQAHRFPADRPVTRVQPQSQAGTRDGWEQASAHDAKAMLQMDAQEWEVEERQRVEQFVPRLDHPFHSEPAWVAEIKADIGEDLNAADTFVDRTGTPHAVATQKDFSSR